MLTRLAEIGIGSAPESLRSHATYSDQPTASPKVRFRNERGPLPEPFGLSAKGGKRPRPISRSVGAD